MALATRAPLAVLSAVLVLAAGCTDAGDGPELEDTPGVEDLEIEPAGWQPCPDVPAEVLGDLVSPGFVGQLTEGVTYECATIAVPQDWNVPDGATFDVALLRARTDNQGDRIGSLLVNPGGPGASGVDLAVYLSFGPSFGGLPTEVTDRFDIVGFDPRGVQRSTALECFSAEDLDASFAADPDPDTAAELEEALVASERMAATCEQKYGADTLSLFSTHQTARDMDAIREAVGDEQLTYLGFSYGSLLGAVYAQLFPDTIRAMVLDGAVDPTRDRLDRSRGQAEGFELAFDNFAEWCGQDPDQCPLGDDVRAAVTDALDDARESPAVGSDGREATSGWIYYAIISALYSERTWPALAAAIDQLDGGDPTGVFDLADAYVDRSADGQYSNLWEANTAVSCADRTDGAMSVAEVRELQEQWRDEMPLFGGPAALGGLGCVHWPAEPDPYPTGPADGAPPIVVVGTTGDPATPYESTQRLADMLGVGVVVTYDGEGHTAYPESDCVAGNVNAYLVDLDVPEDGVTCD
jgi:pimeloyl-ACP methyl ester carboxylesterase